MDTFLLHLLEFPCLSGTKESFRISVCCPKRNGALQHLEIKNMMDIYQIVLANISPNYKVFWVILTLSISQGKSIDTSIMYYSNKTFSGVLRGAGGWHVKSLINLLYFNATCSNFAPWLDTYRFNK